MLAYEAPKIELLGEGELQGVQGEAWSPFVLVAIAVARVPVKTVALAVVAIWAWAWRK